MPEVTLKNLTKSYGVGYAVVDLNLSVGEGEFFSLLGPSGCGKSTTLRMIAGFVVPSRGEIRIGGDDVTNVPPERRDIGIVFQNYAIFPHMNVAENIAFGLKLRKVPKEEIQRRVAGALKQVGLAGCEDRFQRQLSGGEQQRVALARVLVTEPRILLLDEPLSALDKGLREEMKYWIKDLQKRLGITTIYVTHGQDEALTMSDQIAVMFKGRLAQVGSPEDIYERPQNIHVATFVGHANVVPAKVLSVAQGYCTVSALGTTMRVRAGVGIQPGIAAKVVFRPESVGFDLARGDTNRFDAVFIRATYQGPVVRLQAETAGQTINIDVANGDGLIRPTKGENLALVFDPGRATAFPDASQSSEGKA